MVRGRPMTAGGSITLRSAFRLHALLAAATIAFGAGIAAAQQAAGTEPEEEYGEFLARPAELVSVPINDIARSLRLNAGAMLLGK
jgi:hypothetical protein